MLEEITSLSLRTVQERPFNAEAPLPVLTEIPTPTPLFYVRSNFDVPAIDVTQWRLRVTGAVQHEREFAFADLAQFAQSEALVLLECAGNGRRRMVPVPSGVGWDFGAVSCAVFKGVVLADLLHACGASPAAVEVLFTGADEGEVEPGRRIAFQRSVPIAKALDPTVLLATHMNREPLTPAHGYPIRVLVPGWYAVSSVKWLLEIRVLEVPFEGHFQTERYVYIEDPIAADQEPVRETRVRSLIAQPSDAETLRCGRQTVKGIAWSGAAPIECVELSVDGGATWHQAQLGAATGPNAPTPWSHDWDAQPGSHILLARATDRAGNRQPTESIYNRLGYGNNVVHAISVNVE
jgi:DMSO/TMAO reductase YedYZ molybdopterin-dependent catalytic subunit